jgi:thymidylate synthase (FAD)
MTTTLITHTPEYLISECAKICYATKPLEDGGRDITSDLVHGRGHLAALRFAFAVVKVDDVSIACQNQIVRSKHLDFMVQSKRYVNPDKGDFKFIMPEAVEGDREKAIMEKCWHDSKYAYETLINLGVKKEDARAILPMNTSTKMYISGNLQSWMDFFKLRLNPHAQAEVNDVAISIYALLQEVYPQVFTAELFEKLSK